MKENPPINKSFWIAVAIFSFIVIILAILFFFSREIFTFSLLSLAPISELRGSIPLAYFSYEWSIWIVFPFAILLNLLVSPLVFLFLDQLHPLFYRWSFYRRLFDRFITKARVKMHNKVEKYGMLGIMIFIGIPLPITGVYTGTAGAWILGLNRKKTILAALGGVVMSGLIVSIIVLLIQYGLLSEESKNILNFFIKNPDGH